VSTAAAGAIPPRTLGGLIRYFLRLGSSGFGGPIALVGYMQRDLVEERRWFTAAEYRQGLALAQTMPGPLAAQLAMWFGYLQAGAVGAAAAIAPFVLPPCLLVTAVAVVYARYEGPSVVHQSFLGVGPAVLAIIAIAPYKLALDQQSACGAATARAPLRCRGGSSAMFGNLSYNGSHGYRHDSRAGPPGQPGGQRGQDHRAADVRHPSRHASRRPATA
jgi:chromate transport protein ChrA